ncbi:MAG: methylglyoxal synthase [Eubacteriales bacterium]|nr:methylglyoxal synthase [Eubacteriales bacterium]
MNIALIAHDKKKELMADFCLAYKRELQRHELLATGATGALVAETAGLNIRLLSSGLAGEEQIAARIAYNEIDLVIFLRDPDTAAGDLGEPQMNSLLKLCDINSIPFATNIATAELLVKALERGDLEWRELVRKKT